MNTRLISTILITGMPEVQMRHKNRSKESNNAKPDFIEASNQTKGKNHLDTIHSFIIRYK